MSLARTPLPSLVAAALIAGVAPACTGGEKLCTEMGCPVAVQVDFNKQSPWAAGTYAVTVTRDGQAVECSAQLPLSCDAPPPCGDEDMFLVLEGCALPPEQHKLGGVQFIRGTPKGLTISVALGEDVLGDAEFGPTYKTWRPNGEGCDPECTRANETMIMKLR